MAQQKKKSVDPVVKDEVVRLRISCEQKAALVSAAKREGLVLSSWLRRLALREAGLLPGWEGVR